MLSNDKATTGRMRRMSNADAPKGSHSSTSRSAFDSEATSSRSTRQGWGQSNAMRPKERSESDRNALNAEGTLSTPLTSDMVSPRSIGSGGDANSTNEDSVDSSVTKRAVASALPSATTFVSPSSAMRANSLSAYSATLSAESASVALHNSSAPFVFRQPFQPQMSYHQAQQHVSIERFTADLTNCIIAFLSPILPTEEEYRIKEATRRQLERLTGKVSPGAKLLAFGSMANGFALKNSDMDLCCLVTNGDDAHDTREPLNASALVEALGKILRDETDYTVMPLPKARIPIIKISRPPTSELPYDISCDIGFENRLALENTRLLLSYAMVDPPRLRTLVLFLKVWTKRRKLNSPYTGTLSSYGYTLMMIFFLMHVKRPAVLPNLQRIPPTSTTKTPEKASLNGHNIYFYDDVAALRKQWSSQNTENVGELLLDFFKYFSKEFGYSRDVISIRSESGVFLKDGKTWNAELCIEDPFQSGYNVARTVTRDGLYTIRGEFIRASRILTTRMNRVSAALAELCEEREDGLTRAPDASHFTRHRHSAAPLTFLNSNLYLPSGGFDPRYLREFTRRFEAGAQSPGGFGGSFAFEEMARGLAQAQQGGQGVAFPPTTAMLAPLSQNVGLSPQQSLMRAGLRYDAGHRGQSLAAGMPSHYLQGTPLGAGNGPAGTKAGLSVNTLGSAISGNASVPSTPRLSSSARSVDGGTYGRRKGKRWNANAGVRSDVSANVTAASTGTSSGNISAQTSPRLDHASPRSMLHPDSALNGTYGIGEAFAYGSEISFGSQKFQLYPQRTPKSDAQTGEQSSSSGMLSPASALGFDAAQRGARSLSDGLNRSKSLPRQAGNVDRRSSTPAFSQPPSPSSKALCLAGEHPATECAQDSASELQAKEDTSAVSPRHSKSKRFSSISQTNTKSNGLYSLDGALTGDQRRLPSQSASGSPYLTASPWSFFAPTDEPTDGTIDAPLYAGSSASIATGDEESFALLDDDDEESGERVSLSDGTMDDLARESGVGSSMGGHPLEDHSSGCDDERVGSEERMEDEKRRTITLVTGSEPMSRRRTEEVAEVPSGKEHDVRSWAASQREELDRQHRTAK